MSRWRVEHRTGDAATLHAESMALHERTLRVHHVSRPAIVLGSTQHETTMDPAALARHGLELARRRSGGGAVHLDPPTSLWIDLSVPSSDPLWNSDVERAAWWVGEAWAAALGELAVEAPIEVHRRGLSDRALGRLACFASLGPGEVSIAGRKVVGISQRRTRDGARFQCVASSEWDPTVLIEALAATDPDTATHAALRSALELRAAAIPADGGWSVVERLLDVLP